MWGDVLLDETLLSGHSRAMSAACARRRAGYRDGVVVEVHGVGTVDDGDDRQRYNEEEVGGNGTRGRRVYIFRWLARSRPCNIEMTSLTLVGHTVTYIYLHSLKLTGNGTEDYCSCTSPKLQTNV